MPRRHMTIWDIIYLTLSIIVLIICILCLKIQKIIWKIRQITHLKDFMLEWLHMNKIGSTLINPITRICINNFVWIKYFGCFCNIKSIIQRTSRFIAFKIIPTCKIPQIDLTFLHPYFYIWDIMKNVSFLSVKTN